MLKIAFLRTVSEACNTAQLEGKLPYLDWTFIAVKTPGEAKGLLWIPVHMSNPDVRIQVDVFSGSTR